LTHVVLNGEKKKKAVSLGKKKWGGGVQWGGFGAENLSRAQGRRGAGKGKKSKEIVGSL